MVLRKAAGGQDLLRSLTVAATIWRKTVGLMGRKGLGPDDGLMIPRCRAVHTFFMRFSIGLVFVDERNAVVSVRKSVGPWRLAFERRAAAVIECAADAPWLAELRPGDKLEILEK